MTNSVFQHTTCSMFLFPICNIELSFYLYLMFSLTNCMSVCTHLPCHHPYLTPSHIVSSVLRMHLKEKHICTLDKLISVPTQVHIHTFLLSLSLHHQCLLQLIIVTLIVWGQSLNCCIRWCRLDLFLSSLLFRLPSAYFHLFCHLEGSLCWSELHAEEQQGVN